MASWLIAAQRIHLKHMLIRKLEEMANTCTDFGSGRISEAKRESSVYCFQGERTQFFPRMGSAVPYSTSLSARVYLGFLTGLLAQQSQAVSLEVCGLEPVICSPSEVHPGIDERKLVPDERDLTAKQKAELILSHVVPIVITAGIAQGTETSHQSLSQLQYPTFCISF